MRKIKKTLETGKVDGEIRLILKNLAASVIPTRAKVKEAAAVIGMAETSLEQMRIYGKGSVVSWVKLALYKYDLTPNNLERILSGHRAATPKLEELDATDRVYQEVKRRFSDDELYAWLKLLVAKYEIEKELKVRKKKKK